MEGLGFGLFGFWLAHLAAVVSPGPSFVVVSRAAVSGSVAGGVAIAAGLAFGTLLWASAAVFGLAVLLEAYPNAFAVIQVAGAAFLAFVAVQLWRHAGKALEGSTDTHGEGSGSAFLLGVGVQLANPKVAIFFGSIFALVLPPDPSGGVIAAVITIACANEFGWYAIVALALARPRVRSAYLRASGTIDRATGVVLVVFAAQLLFG